MKRMHLSFRQMLTELDVDRAAADSTFNHHVNGLDYLCLHRTPGLTMKLYLMERPENPNGGFLVYPHSHRYSFWTVCLAGALKHMRFGYGDGWTEPPGPKMVELRYDADTKTVEPTGAAGCLEPRASELVTPGCEYFVHPNEVHTLRMEGTRPVLLGLMQFGDVVKTNMLYTPTHVGLNFKTPASYKPTPAAVEAVRQRCLNLIDWNVDKAWA